jgi:hypothetical protein
MPAVLATQRSGRLWFEVSLGQIVLENLSRKNPSQKGFGGGALGVGYECKLQYRKNKNPKSCGFLKS